MAFLKKIILLAIIVGSAGYSAYVLLKGPCDSPITYKIGSFDTRFKISKTDFLDALKQAETIWEKAAGKDLFTYSAQGDLPVNLIYDSRQATADKNKTLESKVTQTQGTAEEIKKNFENLKARYEAEKADYTAMIGAYEKAQASYTSEVQYWNNQGGAPKSEYEKLESERAELKHLQDLLEQKRVEVNNLGDQVNALVGSYNSLVKVVNSNIDKINQSADKEFEQGEYISSIKGSEIDIYEFDTKSKLVRTLTHELGHALTIGHNDNPDSIMYYLNKSDGLSLSSDDVSSLKQVCRLKN